MVVAAASSLLAGFASPPHTALRPSHISWQAGSTLQAASRRSGDPSRTAAPTADDKPSGAGQRVRQARRVRQELSMTSSSTPQDQVTTSASSTSPARLLQTITAMRVVIAVVRQFLARIILVVSLAVLTLTSLPAWGMHSSSSGSRQLDSHSPEIHLIARADASGPAAGTHAKEIRYDNVKAWHRVWGGPFDELPMWSKMARERVVMFL